MFLLLLSGRFSLGRLSPELAIVDMRWVLLVTSLLVFAAWVVVERVSPKFRAMSPGLMWFVLWCGWLIVSAAWTPSGVDVGAQIENIVLLALSVILAILLLRRLPLTGLRLFWWLTLAAALVYFVAALAAGPGTIGRFSAFGGGPNVFVRIMVIGAVAALAVAVNSRRNWSLLAAPVLSLGALLSGSRGGIVAAIGILIISSIPVARRLGFRRSLVALVPFIAVAWLVPRLLGPDQIDVIYQRFVVQPFIQQDLSSRDVLANRALELFGENSLVGAGIGAVAHEFAFMGEGLHAHNLLLSTAAEGGIVGVVLLILSVVSLIITVMRVRPMSADTLFALLAGLFVFGAAMFSGDYFDSRFAWFFMALAIAFSRSEGNYKSPSLSNDMTRFPAPR